MVSSFDGIFVTSASIRADGYLGTIPNSLQASILLRHSAASFDHK